MSIPFYTNVDLSKNQLLNVLFHILASAPSSPKEGQFYYNSTDKKFYYYDGTRWIGSGEYNLPIATTNALGGIIVSTGLSVDASGNLSVKLIDNLTSTATDSALTAKQGKELKSLIDTINTVLGGLGTAATKNTGTSSGNVPILDSNGKLSTSVIPAMAITDVYTCASEAAMLALTAQQGDICIRTDNNTVYILSQTPASTLANWIPIEIPMVITSVNGQTGAVVLTGSDINATTTIKTTSTTNTINNLLTALNTYIGEVKTTADGASTDIGTVRTSLSGDHYATDIGNGNSTSITVTHNLGTKDIIVELYEKSTGQTVYTDVTRTTTNAIRLDFATAPSSNQFRVLIKKIDTGVTAPASS